MAELSPGMEPFEYVERQLAKARELVTSGREPDEFVMTMIDIKTMTARMTKIAIEVYEGIFKHPVEHLVAERAVSREAEAFMNENTEG